MRRATKTALKIVAAAAATPLVIIALAALRVSLYTGPRFTPPAMPDGWAYGVAVTEDVDGTLRCRRSLCQTVKEGLTVVTLRGNAAERGADYAALCGSLIRRQEDVFLSRTIEAVGGQWALRAMLWVADAAGFDFSKFMTEDLRQETWAMAQACAPHSKYDDLGDAYTRQILYQAAHDMGHAMSQHLNVTDVKAGCSSFAVKGHRAAALRGAKLRLLLRRRIRQAKDDIDRGARQRAAPHIGMLAWHAWRGERDEQRGAERDHQRRPRGNSARAPHSRDSPDAPNIDQRHHDSGGCGIGRQGAAYGGRVGHDMLRNGQLRRSD